MTEKNHIRHTQVALLLLYIVHLSFHSAEATTYGLPTLVDQNFMCNNFDKLCENLLSEIGCTNMTYVGCPGWPNKNDLQNFKGVCTCFHPTYYDVGGTRVTQQLISNRIAQDMYWMLEPWSTGPPYDIKLSYTRICERALDRLGCPANETIVHAYDTRIHKAGAKAPFTNFTCACGSGLTQTTAMIDNMIMDKLNDYNLRSLPIWEDPVTLSVPLSMCVTLICGKIGAIIATYLGLPPIVGFLLAGLGIQNTLSLMFLKGAGYPYPSPASELKTIALIIVLMRAGLSIKFDEIWNNGTATFILSTLPYFAEFFIWLYVGQLFFGWNTIDMGMFASIMAPLGPSVVISGL